MKRFSTANITKDTYICSKHFISGCGPTENNPDPILATLTEAEIEKMASRKWKAPKQRDPPNSTPKRNRGTNHKDESRLTENIEAPGIKSTDDIEASDIQSTEDEIIIEAHPAGDQIENTANEVVDVNTTTTQTV